MQRLIITGANGVGKSHLAAKLTRARPDVPIVSFDAIKLKTDWRQRSRSEIMSSLDVHLKRDAWILEGGPSLLPHAIAKADALVWLDPPEFIRAWRLAKRPWQFLGKTRPELPSGNIDWPIQQYRFAIRSLKNKSKFQSFIADVFHASEHLRKWHCRDRKSIDRMIEEWSQNAS